MFSLLYVSEETARLEPEQLMALLRESRTRNRERGLTGLLAYRAGHYMQVLEGQAEVVELLFQSIERDKRHCGVARIWQGEIEARRFQKWPMAFRFLSDAQLERLPRFEAMIDQGFTGEGPRDQPELALSFMQALRDVV